MPVVKNVQDYYEKMFELYPEINKSDIKRILQYGWKSFYLHNSYGGDVLINRNGFWMYTGTMMSDSLKFFGYYQRKMVTKLRVLYKRKKVPFDGYYYFALTKNQYEAYLNQKNKRGRPKKHFKFSKVFLYKIYDECNIVEHNAVAIFKIYIGSEIGFVSYREELITDKAEFMFERNTMKFEDILVTKYDYQFLDNNLKYKSKKL